jgi:hypothetical protein
MSQMEAIMQGAWKINVNGKRIASLLPNGSFAEAARGVLMTNELGSVQQRYDGSIVWEGRDSGAKVTFR